MSTERFTAPTSRGNLLTTQLNSLASGGTYSAVGTELDNATNRDRYGAAELNVTFGSAPTADMTCELFYVAALDGTNYEDGGSTVRPNPMNSLGTFPVRAVTTAQRILLPLFQLPPLKVKFVLLNATDQNFPASGSTVAVYTFNREVA